MDKWDSLSRIAEISAPLLVLHGGKDVTVPLRFGQTLFQAALEPKDMVLVEEAGHVDLLDYPKVSGQVVSFIRANAEQ